MSRSTRKRTARDVQRHDEESTTTLLGRSPTAAANDRSFFDARCLGLRVRPSCSERWCGADSDDSTPKFGSWNPIEISFMALAVRQASELTSFDPRLVSKSGETGSIAFGAVVHTQDEAVEPGPNACVYRTGAADPSRDSTRRGPPRGTTLPAMRCNVLVCPIPRQLGLLRPQARLCRGTRSIVDYVRHAW